MVHLNEGAGKAPRVRAMLEMEDGPRVYALRGCRMRLFEVRCAQGLESYGEGVRSQGGREK